MDSHGPKGLNMDQGGLNVVFLGEKRPVWLFSLPHWSKRHQAVIFLGIFATTIYL